MPDSALTASKEKKLTGRQYFESGRHIVVLYPRQDILFPELNFYPVAWLLLLYDIFHGYYLLYDIFHVYYLLYDIFHLFHRISIQKEASTAADEDEEEEEDIEFDDDFEGKVSSS
jgi:hypothetical protein